MDGQSGMPVPQKREFGACWLACLFVCAGRPIGLPVRVELALVRSCGRGETRRGGTEPRVSLRAARRLPGAGGAGARLSAALAAPCLVEPRGTRGKAAAAAATGVPARTASSGRPCLAADWERLGGARGCQHYFLTRGGEHGGGGGGRSDGSRAPGRRRRRRRRWRRVLAPEGAVARIPPPPAAPRGHLASARPGPAESRAGPSSARARPESDSGSCGTARHGPAGPPSFPARVPCLSPAASGAGPDLPTPERAAVWPVLRCTPDPRCCCGC